MRGVARAELWGGTLTSYLQVSYEHASYQLSKSFAHLAWMLLTEMKAPSLSHTRAQGNLEEHCHWDLRET